LSDPEVVEGDIAIDPEEQEQEQQGRERRWWGLLAVILILLLLMFCIVTSVDVWVRGGSEQARFIARNAECLQCHTELIPEFGRADVHDPFAKRDCTTCHTKHGKVVSVRVDRSAGEAFKRFRTMLEWLPLRWFFSLTEGSVQEAGTVGAASSDQIQIKAKGGESMLVLPPEELCWMCHGDLGVKLSDPFPHQPFMAGRCGNCHNPHASDYSSLLTQAPNRICLTCHPFSEELAKQQVHPPAEQGWCTDCHDPHASKFKGILEARQRELCFRCHPTVAVMEGLPVQHQPFLNDNCTGCHEHHASDDLPLLDAPQPQLCYNCHPAIRNQFALPSSHPIGLELTCGSCHDPHAAQYSGLLNARNNSFCYQCHASFQVTYEANDHRGTLCIRCHTPHGSRYTPILRAANPPLCLQCHARRDFDENPPNKAANNHPVGPAHYDVNARKNLTCTTSCHNPHGTELNFMLRYFEYPKDGGCLMCHAVTPGKRVGIDF